MEGTNGSTLIWAFNTEFLKTTLYSPPFKVYRRVSSSTANWTSKSFLTTTVICLFSSEATYRVCILKCLIISLVEIAIDQKRIVFRHTARRRLKINSFFKHAYGVLNLENITDSNIKNGASRGRLTVIAELASPAKVLFKNTNKIEKGLWKMIAHSCLIG